MSRMRAYFFKIKSCGAKDLLREFRFLWQYIRRYRGAVCVYILLGILGVAAGLAAQGETQIMNPQYIDRGYERFEENLRSLGAEVYRI